MKCTRWGYAFFSVWRHGFFVLRNVHSQCKRLSSRRELTVVFVCHRTVSRAAVYQLKIKYDQDKIRSSCLDAFDTIKRAVSFPLEDKHIVNEHHEIRKKPWCHTEKNVLTWCISMYHVIGLNQTRGIKNVTLKTAKKFAGVAVYWEE